MKPKIHKILLSLFMLAMVMSCGVTSKSIKESDYSDFWCEEQGGDFSAVLEDGTKPDCILEDEVIEFDWGKGNKPYECVGQALHYSRISGKSPVCALIKTSSISADNFQRAVDKVKGGDVKVICINADKQTFRCP